MMEHEHEGTSPDPHRYTRPRAAGIKVDATSCSVRRRSGTALGIDLVFKFVVADSRKALQNRRR